MIKHKILCYEQFDHLFLFVMLDVNKCFIAQIQQTQNPRCPCEFTSSVCDCFLILVILILTADAWVGA